jgi:phosphoglycolate phosphatase-like HAD superfamily hydrolase
MRDLQMRDIDWQQDWLILDFDGVVVDSIEECLVVGYNAAMQHLEKPQRITNLQQLPFEQVNRLRWLRNFVRTGEDYVFLCLADLLHRQIANQQEFDQFIAENNAIQPRLRQLFYQTRQAFLMTWPEQWLALNPFYPGMEPFLSMQGGNPHCLILTTKQLSYVRAILDHAGLNFSNERLFSVLKGSGKLEVLQALMQKYAIPANRVHFVDDQVDTLIKTQPIGVNLYLATWGYVNTDQLALARGAAITTLSLEEFYQFFPA